jgi:hypothetical protein
MMKPRKILQLRNRECRTAKIMVNQPFHFYFNPSSSLNLSVEVKMREAIGGFAEFEPRKVDSSSVSKRDPAH